MLVKLNGAISYFIKLCFLDFKTKPWLLHLNTARLLLDVKLQKC